MPRHLRYGSPCSGSLDNNLPFPNVSMPQPGWTFSLHPLTAVMGHQWIHGLTLLWQILAIDWRNWIHESDFQ